MIRDTASKRFARSAGPAAVKRGPDMRVRGRIPHPLTWLNIVCLDAPLVAVGWQWLFARSFDVTVPSGGTAALFLTAWLIYLADRLGDSAAINDKHATSLRQRFCLEHRRAWIVALALVAAADLLVISAALDSHIIRFAAPLGLLALAYLFLNQRHPAVWRFVAAKEITIGVLFAAGTIVAIAPRFSRPPTLPWLFFAALCSFNCISIAVWERWLDEAQRRVSIATAFPRVGRYVAAALLMLFVASLASTRHDNSEQLLYVCVAASAALLLVVHLMRRRIQPDVRTALADIVMLTPAVVLLVDAGR